MHNPSTRIILYSSLAIVLLVFMWGVRQIPNEGHLADQALRESLSQEIIVLNGAVKAATAAMKYRLLDVLKAEGNDHVTRTFQDSPFLAVTLLEWNQVEWKSLWYSNKSKTDLQSSELKKWLTEWPLSKLAIDEVYFTKVGNVEGQAYFAMLVPVRKPNQIPMVGVGIFPAAQFGLNFSSDENREVRVFTQSGVALALSHPAYLGANVKSEPLVREMLETEEVSLRHEWKSDGGVRMIGLSSRISDSNLSVAIETKAAAGSKLAAWAYLILCAIGAGIVNWVLFSSVFRTVIAQLSTAEETNEFLRRQLAEAPRAGVIPAADPIVPAAELSDMDFMDAIAAAEGAEPVPTTSVPTTFAAESEEISIAGSTSLANVVGAAIRALDKRIVDAKINVMIFGLEDLKLQAEPLQLQTAIEEVIKNSIEAMTNSPLRNLTISGRRQGDRLRLIVEDTGAGIPDDNVAKVFDPFFSTKDAEGVARGLGLNVVRRVVEELEGNVKIQSRQNSEGMGTRVDIDLPCDKDSVAAKESVAAVGVPDFPLPEETADTEDFQITGIPAVSFQEKKQFPEFSIRKPIVRTLD